MTWTPAQEANTIHPPVLPQVAAGTGPQKTWMGVSVGAIANVSKVAGLPPKRVGWWMVGETTRENGLVRS